MELSSAEIKRIQEEAATKRGFREALVKEVENIEGLPDMQRWRAIKNLLLKVNPKLKPLDDHFIAEVRKTRENQLNEFGASKSGDVRQLIDMPVFLYQAIMLADKDFSYKVNVSRDREEQKRTWRKMAKAFPEYAIARTV